MTSTGDIAAVDSRPKAEHMRTLPTASPRSPRTFRVLLLVWEELWSLVRIIPAEVSLVAGGPGPLRTPVSPAEGHV